MEVLESLLIPPLLVAVHCQHKSRPVGTIVRSASALGAKMLLLVGDNRVGMHGAFGSNQRIVILHFESWGEARRFLESRQNRIFYYGISPPGVVDETSGLQSLANVSFPALGENESTCFVVGGKAEPLSEEIRAFLDVPIKVDFPNPYFASRLKFEEVLAVAIHKYISTMRSREGGDTRLFQPCEWSGEKFVKDGTISTGGNGRRGISVSKLTKRASRDEEVQSEGSFIRVRGINGR